MTEWRKSSYSAEDANCVEVAWRKSSFSGEDSNCVEVAHTERAAAIRDSKNPDGPHLVLGGDAYRKFVTLSRIR